MSYGITVYFNDEDIDNTYIYTSYFTHRGYYGDDYYSTSGLTFSVKFTANPADGCKFTRWVYRLGSTSGTVQYSYSNPFTYSGDEDIYIRAEGESTPSWTRYTGSFGTISSLDYVDISLGEYELYRYSVSFEESGTAYFYTEGTQVDVCGYLSTTSGWDSEYGEPSSYLKYDDDGHGAPNFGIQYEVEAGTTYYVWVRGLSEYASGDVTLYIEPPAAPTWTLVIGAFGTISSEASASFTLGTNQMRRYSVSFENSGSANFFAMGSEDTWGYLSTTTGFDSTNGMPTSYLAEDGTSGPGDNFAITYNVTAGTTYYVWVCESYGESTGTIELYVQPPEKTISITKWSWTASNGNASASLTQAAYSAVVDKTVVTNFSYLVWNDLCDKVKEILDATGDSWDSTYATYANTKMSSSNKTLTATKFNSLRYNIGSHYSTGISDVYTNDDVLGSYFTKLASCINGWIDTL